MLRWKTLSLSSKADPYTNIFQKQKPRAVTVPPWHDLQKLRDRWKTGSLGQILFQTQNQMKSLTLLSIYSTDFIHPLHRLNYLISILSQTSSTRPSESIHQKRIIPVSNYLLLLKRRCSRIGKVTIYNPHSPRMITALPWTF